MGKPGAYLQIDRKEHGMRPAKDALKDFGEIAQPLSEELQELQASRCMYCGVAFCQTGISFGRARTSGCPLHNLIPEWNDLLYRGLWDDAAARMSLTNPFPEFTGRVCPALCEVACNLGLHQEPMTIKDDERAISDHAWASGYMKPLPKHADDAKSVAVVGSGPSGLAAAWELARRGFAVTVVEKSDRPGGLLMYGIPNMKLPKEVVNRRVKLMEESGITFETSRDATDPAVAEWLKNSFDAIVVAAGAGAARTLKVPGAEGEGVVLAVDFLTSSTKSVISGKAPAISAKGKDVVVIGGGDTGTDCVATSLRQGAKSVHQLEFLPAPADKRPAGNAWPEWPNVKKTDYGQLEAKAVQGEDPRSWASDTMEVLRGKDGKLQGLKVADLDWSAGKPQRIEGSEHELPAQLVLIAMGFSGPTAEVLSSLGVDAYEFRGGVRPTLAAKDKHRAEAEGTTPVFVAGDTRNGSSLVVTAIADGLACAAEVAEAL
ncbi:MAG: glutamate synthase subunit beta [Atopobiaceae bacterium]